MQAPSADELDAFRKAAEAGAPLPSVDPADLRRMWEFSQEIRSKYGEPKEGMMAIDSRLLAAELSPGAYFPAIWFRAGLLWFFHQQGLLAEWQHGTALDDAVFQAAATFPVSGMRVDRELFLADIRKAGG